jgi:HEAT repeat protein
MDHDDEQVRWLAVAAISKNVSRSFDDTLKMMLRDEDLRKRGLAAYIAAHLWKHESYPILQQMLREPAQLLRFDAISALAIDDSSAARRIVREHRRHESHPTLLELIDKVPAR